MNRRPPRSTRTGPRFPYTTPFRSVAEDTQYVCPGLDEAGEAEARDQAERTFAALGLRGWARVDFMRDRDGRNWLLEANTAPGMTSHSLMPKRSEEHTSELQSLMRISYAVFCLKKKNI